MSEPNNSELYSLITNVCKPSKIFDFPETEQPFAWFEKFPWVCYFWWDDRTYYLPCVLFDHKNVGKSLQKTYQTWRTAVKAFKKTSKCSKGNTRREANIIS